MQTWQHLGNLLWNAHWTQWAEIATVLSAIATTIALVFAILALKASRQATQLQIFESIFKDVRELEKEYYATYAKEEDAEKLLEWLSLLFNTLEYVSFLFNTGKLPSGDCLFFYKDVFLDSEEIFNAKMPESTKNNPKAFPEFRKLAKTLKHQ